MNQRHKRINQAMQGKGQALTTQERELLELLYTTPEDVRSRKRLFIISPTDQQMQTAKAIATKLLPGEDPEQVCVFIHLTKEDQKL